MELLGAFFSSLTVSLLSLLGPLQLFLGLVLQLPRGRTLEPRAVLGLPHWGEVFEIFLSLLILLIV